MLLIGLIIASIFSFYPLNTSPNLTAQVALTNTRAAFNVQANTHTAVARLPLITEVYNRTVIAAIDRVNQNSTQAYNLTATATANHYQTATTIALTTTHGPQSFLRYVQYALIFSDTFDTPNPQWQTTITQAQVNNGKYQWQITGNTVQLASVTLNPASKFYFVAKILIRQDAPDAQYGLLFRQTNNEFYAFTISSAQIYTVTHYTHNQPRVVLRAPSRLINPAEVNQLAILGDGPKYSFYINEKFVDGFTDTQLQGNTFGLLSHPLATTDEVLLEFDEVEFRTAPNTGLPTATPNPTRTPTAPR